MRHLVLPSMTLAGKVGERARVSQPEALAVSSGNQTTGPLHGGFSGGLGSSGLAGSLGRQATGNDRGSACLPPWPAESATGGADRITRWRLHVTYCVIDGSPPWSGCENDMVFRGIHGPG